MKMRRPHVVPLSRQVLELLEEVQYLDDTWVFPGSRARDGQMRPISEKSVRLAMRDAGIGPEECTPHGWRSTASTLLNEAGWDSGIIELQLAHRKRGKVAAIYDRSEKLGERAGLMQAWSDMLDAMRARA
jgi:integrase